MANKGEVRYRLTLETNDFSKAMEGAAKQFEEFGKTLLAGFVTFEVGEKAAELLTEAIKGIPEAIGAAVEHVAEMSHQMEMLSLKTGLSTQTLQELKYAASVTGGDIDQLAGMVNKMEKNLVAGNKAFAALGLSVQQLRAETPEQAFDQIAEKIRGLASPMDQAAAAMAIFGKAGGDALALIKTGVAGLSDEAHRMGVVLSDDDVRAAAELSVETKKLGLAWEGLQNTFAATIARSPELLAMFKDITRAVTDMTRYIHDHRQEIADFANILAGIGRTAVTGIRGLLGIPAASGNSISATADLAPEGHKPSFDPGAAEAAAKLKKILDEPLLGSAWGNLLGGGTGGIAGGNAFKDNLAKLGDDAKTYYENLKEGEKEVAAALAQRIALHGQLAANEKAFMESWLHEHERVIQNFEQEGAMLNALSSALQAFGISGSNAFVQIIDGLAMADQAMANFEKATSTAGKALVVLQTAGQIYQKGSVLGGAVTGAAMGMEIGGPIGAGIGAIAGGLLGLFGHAKKAREELKKLQDQALATFNDLKKQIEALKMQFLTDGVKGLAAMFTELGTQTGATTKQFDDLGIVGMAMFEELKREGMTTVQAMEAMGPALDAAIAAASKAGVDLGGTFGVLADFRAKVLANKDLVNAIDGWAQAFDALNATGNMSADMFTRLSGMLEGYLAELEKQHFTHEQILAMAAPDLYRLYLAEQKYGFAVDETTQKLIDEAKAGGYFDNLTDPMQKLVELQGLMLEAIAALVKAFGKDLPAAVQKYIDSLHKVPAVPGAPVTPGDPGGDPSTHGGGRPEGHAAGLTAWIPSTPGGVSLGAYGHAGEGGEPELLSIIPASKLGGGGGPNIHVHVQIGEEQVQGIVSRAIQREAYGNGPSMSYLKRAITGKA